MRLDHLLSKEESKGWFIIELPMVTKTKLNKVSGGDALRGHTRSHPEHDG